MNDLFFHFIYHGPVFIHYLSNKLQFIYLCLFLTFNFIKLVTQCFHQTYKNDSQSVPDSKGYR